jgi:hypothetical protein
MWSRSQEMEGSLRSEEGLQEAVCTEEAGEELQKGDEKSEGTIFFFFFPSDTRV